MAFSGRGMRAHVFRHLRRFDNRPVFAALGVVAIDAPLRRLPCWHKRGVVGLYKRASFCDVRRGVAHRIITTLHQNGTRA